MPVWKSISFIQSRSIQFRYTHAGEILPQTYEVGLIVFYKSRLRSFDKASLGSTIPITKLLNLLHASRPGKDTEGTVMAGQ